MLRPMQVAIIVVNFGSAELLGEYIGQAGYPPQVGVVVVDNFHSHEERGAISSLAAAHRWVLLSPARNLGFGAACNLGVRWAKAEGYRSVLFLNPDATIALDDLERLAMESERHPNALMSPIIHKPDGSVWFQGGILESSLGIARHVLPDGKDARPVDWLTAACLLVPMHAFEALGGFEEAYFLYWEDVDLTWRHKLAGGELRVSASSRAIHNVGGTQESEDKSPAYFFFNTRNRIWFARRNFGRARTASWSILTLIYVAHLARLGGLRHGRVAPAVFASSVLRGAVAGFGRLTSSRTQTQMIGTDK